MKGGSVTDSPSNVGVPRLCVGVPLVVCPVALLNGGIGVVRAQPGEHARYPRTPLRPLSCCLLCSCFLFSVPRLFSPCAFPFVGMAVCDLPCVGVLCWHDGDG